MKSKIIKTATKGLLGLAATWVGFKVIGLVFGLATSFFWTFLPMAALTATIYGGWKWMKNLYL